VSTTQPDASPPSRGRGRPPKGSAVLSREKVLAAALALVDRYGLEELSIRSLARTLGVKPMSLYNHVANKQDLLDTIHEAVLTEALKAQAHGDSWRSGLRLLAHALRRGLRAHPNAIPLLASRPARSPALLAAGNELLGMLLDAGFTPHQALYALDAVAAFVIGHAIAEFAAFDEAVPERDGQDLAAQATHLRDAGLTHLARVVVETTPHDYTAEFDQGLTALIEGHDSLLQSRQ
jgi:TetR/AcrR family tetracycline transcriptional repressor